MTRFVDKHLRKLATMLNRMNERLLMLVIKFKWFWFFYR